MKTEKRKMSDTVLMAMRCEYVSGHKLTKKGKGFFTPKIYRLISHIQCKLSKGHRNRMYEFLTYAQAQTEAFNN